MKFVKLLLSCCCCCWGIQTRSQVICVSRNHAKSRVTVLSMTVKVCWMLGQLVQIHVRYTHWESFSGCHHVVFHNWIAEGPCSPTLRHTCTDDCVLGFVLLSMGVPALHLLYFLLTRTLWSAAAAAWGDACYEIVSASITMLPILRLGHREDCTTGNPEQAKRERKEDATERMAQNTPS